MMLPRGIMRNLTGVIAVLALVASAACTKPDERLTKAVQDRLASDQIVRGYHLDVKTDQKVVSVSGTVDTTVAKEQALSIAKATTGVVEVRDHIAVRDNEGTKGWLNKSNGAIGTSGRQ
jgi:osmotically-inducible protein OsmY